MCSRQLTVVPEIPGWDSWLTALERRHLADLRMSEVARALRALSSTYVERRGQARGRALDGAGKRAAFALFYAPIHFMLVHAIVAQLGPAEHATEVIDLGCGTGVAGAAWALSSERPARIAGIDVHPWTLAEARWTYRILGLRGVARRGDLARVRLPAQGDAIIAAYTLNELAEPVRSRLLHDLVRAAERDVRVLIVEPISTAAVPWWPEWREAFQRIGGRADEWRFRIPLPDLVKRLDQAAALHHDELTGRSLYCASKSGRGPVRTDTIALG
ncbi:MAG: methyltransferase domain-containing protein [Vicinamibacterales bacterium]